MKFFEKKKLVRGEVHYHSILTITYKFITIHAIYYQPATMGGINFTFDLFLGLSLCWLMDECPISCILINDSSTTW